MNIVPLVIVKEIGLSGDDFNGTFLQKVTVKYKLFDHSQQQTTFQVMLTIKISWDNGSSMFFEGNAAVDRAKLYVKPTFEQLQSVVIDCLKRIGSEWSTHSLYKKAGLPFPPHLDIYKENWDLLQQVINNYNL